MGVSKDTKSKSEDELFHGTGGKGITHVEFDRLVSNWALSEYGQRYGKMLWEDTLPEILLFDLMNPAHFAEFDEHVTMIFDNISESNSRHALSLYNSNRYWTIEWQHDWQKRQYEKLYIFVQSICYGEALRQIEDLGVDNAHTIRKHFVSRFGSAQTANLKERQKQYLLGMPDKEGALAIPVTCDLEAKLNQFETERTYFHRNCPVQFRATYKYCQETTMVSMIIEHLPAEYDSTVQDVRNKVIMRKMAAGDLAAGVTTSLDLICQNFSVEWLPPYQDLRTALVDAYQVMKKRCANLRKGNGGQKIPSMIMVGGHPQPGADNITCYACGTVGHKRGDPECTAAKGDVWSGAPDSWKDRQKKRNNDRGKGRDRGNQKKEKKKNGNRDAGVCRNFTTGNGYCRFGDNCKFLHEKARGKGRGNGGRNRGRGRGRNEGGGGGKLIKKEKKNIAAMVLKTITQKAKDAFEKKRPREYDADSDDRTSKAARDDLYKLLRGERDSTSMLINCSETLDTTNRSRWGFQSCISNDSQSEPN
jgi:hypothetical protein